MDGRQSAERDKVSSVGPKTPPPPPTTPPSKISSTSSSLLGIRFPISGRAVTQIPLQQQQQQQQQKKRPRSAFNEDPDDEDDDSNEKCKPSSFVSRVEKQFDDAKRSNTDNAEEDPLDAFMAQMAELAAQENASLKPENIAEPNDHDSFENEVVLGSMYERVNFTSKYSSEDKSYDEDEEVYRVAKAVDHQLAEKGHLELGENNDRKRIIEPLKAIDHSEITYNDFKSKFYQEHNDIALMASTEITDVRKDHEIKVTGSDAPKPCLSFEHFGFSKNVMNVILRSCFAKPTPIQMQTVPSALSGRDVIGISATGSGKTLAFTWPMLTHVMAQPEVQRGEGPVGLVLAPTHELVHQIAKEASRYCKALGIRCMSLTGGANKGDQWKELRAGVEIIIATPGRLIEMVKNKATNLRRVTFFVIDEVDRMFDQGFEAQVSSIAAYVRPNRQTLLFSATFPRSVSDLATRITRNPVKIVVGGIPGSANHDIEQFVHVLAKPADKLLWVGKVIKKFASEGSVLVFVARKYGTEELADVLHTHEVACFALHGDMLQNERDTVVRGYRAVPGSVLVATDVAARGLDIKAIKTVINFDVARNIDTHTHRIGRTGRAGEKGVAHTLLLETESSFAADLVNHLEASGQRVSHELLSIAMKNSKFARLRRGRSGRGGLGYKSRGSTAKEHSGTGPSRDLTRKRNEPSRGKNHEQSHRICNRSIHSANFYDVHSGHTPREPVRRNYDQDPVQKDASRVNSRFPNEPPQLPVGLLPSHGSKNSFGSFSTPTQHHSDSSLAQGAPTSALPKVSEMSKNPLIAAFAKHKENLARRPPEQ